MTTASDGAPRRLVDEEELLGSAVVANNAMNRERGLRGVNSYERELGFDPLGWLEARARDGDRAVAWLDLCCGEARALGEAARLVGDDLGGRVAFVGVDLVGAFDDAAVGAPSVELVEAALSTWEPGTRRFDLITCVHGLHYVGDKLDALARAASWLADDALLVVDLELAALRDADGASLARRAASALRRAGFEVDARRHHVTRRGRPTESLDLGFRYLGANLHAGPNHTGQPAVHSSYESTGRTARA